MPQLSKSQAERRDRAGKIVSILKRLYPDARCSLDHSSPLELLVATILSAQCTDVRVNIVTKQLFKKYRSADEYAKAKSEELEKDIQSTGFYRNKAKSIQAMARSLMERHSGDVPKTMQELVDLAGVGRKTANVVLGNAFDQNEGVVVDTHVTRLANRLGLTRHEFDAVKIEQDLISIVPNQDWTVFSHLLIYHGRKVCTARNPRCRECDLLKLCPTGPKFLKEAQKVAKSGKKTPNKSN